MSIEKKHLVTGALLAFVAVTGVTLAVKETRRSRAVAAAAAADSAAQIARRTRSDLGAPPADPLPAPTIVPTTLAADETRRPAPPPLSSNRESSRKEPAAAAAARTGAPAPAAKAVVPTSPTEPATTVLVTYFHTTTRCVSCVKLENLTEMTMTTRLSGPVTEKRVVFRSVNVDEPVNAHFVKDYGLYTKSVVVSEVKGGFEVRWKNLDQVWHLLGNPESFHAYVEKEVQGFLDPS